MQIEHAEELAGLMEQNGVMAALSGSEGETG